MQEENLLEKEQNDDAMHHSGDKAFKIVMKRKESALELIETFAPDIAKHLDLEHFELDATNYIKPDFAEFYSDVVYRTTLKTKSKQKKKEVAVALLFEHKKTIRSYFLLLLQLLEYLIFIWRDDIANKRSISLIIPIVVFQTKKGLKIKNLHDSFKGVPKELLQYIPNFTYHLTNVHDLSNETILGLNDKKYLRSLLLAYTFTERRKEIDKMLIEVFKFFKDQSNDDNFEMFQSMFTFLAHEDNLDAKEVKELFEQYLSSQQKQGAVMTTYQIWVKKGEKKGIKEGESKKARLVVLRGKWRNFSAEDLADQTELPLTKVKNLFKGYDMAYTFWLKNIGKATDTLPEIAHLSDEEVRYLMDFFTQKQSLVSEN